MSYYINDINIMSCSGGGQFEETGIKYTEAQKW